MALTDDPAMGQVSAGGPVVQGRLYHAPEEAVATQGLLDLLGVRVGQGAA